MKKEIENDDDELEPVIQKDISDYRIQLWKQTQYMSMIDIRVAKKIGDEAMDKAAIESVKKCEKALVELRKMLKEIKLPVIPQNDGEANQ